MNKKQVIFLQIIRPGGTQNYDIHKSEFLLGRGDTSEVPIKDTGISREHIFIRLDENLIQVKDLNSSNGTFVNATQLKPMDLHPVFPNDLISFGNSELQIKVKMVEVSIDVDQEVELAIKKNEPPKVNVDLSVFPKTDEDFGMNFKNIGLQQPKNETAGDKAKEIIKQAEYIKHSIIKSAEVFKAKTINEANLLIKKAKDEAYQEYQRLVDRLLSDTKNQMAEMKTETEIMLDEKRLHAAEEIQNLWKEHNQVIALDKKNQLEIIEKENSITLELASEKLKSQMFAERNKLITDAENEIVQQKRLQQIKYENENAEHLSRLKIHTDQLKKIQNAIDENSQALNLLVAKKDDSEVALSKVISQLKQENENLEFVTNALNQKAETHKKVEAELLHHKEVRNKWQTEKTNTEKTLKDLNHNYSLLTEKKQNLEEEINNLNKRSDDLSKQAKEKVESEYRLLRDAEAKKFADYKANELKELQSIRDSHANAIKKFSVDLSLEIATKIEMLSKKSGNSNFDFDKSFELINSVIQIKSAVTTGSESTHSEQIDSWKKRNSKEIFYRTSVGFVAGLVSIFMLNMVYQKINTDPVQKELARLNLERKQREVENQFIPEKSNKYFDSYVDTTLYTENFAETYLDDKAQQEWVKFASNYFLRQWKVDEEKVIQVISNSRAFVQNIDQMKPTLKKNRIAADIAKMKSQEDEYTKNQGIILGTNVKYEAFKKLEKDFFSKKIKQRSPAQQK